MRLSNIQSTGQTTYRWITGIFLFIILFGLFATPSQAAITVTASGGAGSRSQSLPDSGGAFDLNLPLLRNAVNTITVSATDSQGQTVSKEVKVTQLSLDQIVVSQVTAERLSPQEIKQLVSDGVINLDNPANYNVSKFEIVLTIGNKPVPISVAIPTAIAETNETGSEEFKMPDADNAGPTPPPAPTEIIVFDQPVSGGDNNIVYPSIPGVIIIEGNIKSLKEFYTVRLLLMNTSGIFTLSNVTSKIEFPDGGLTSIAPADGLISFGNILPGDGGTPGQAERQFIIRGDDIGVKNIKVSFGGTVTGPGIPEDTPIPFNGSALTKVEVKGPPSFRVMATHPDSVEKDVPYELKIDITNTGEVPALYTSLALDVGADAHLVRCSESGNSASCSEMTGSDVRSFGDIEPGKTVSATFTIIPEVSGSIASCVGISDQNISLQVLVGTIGCLTGQIPSERGVPDGMPTVAVAPAPNTQGVNVTSAIAAFFSQEMLEATISTGDGGSFNVYDQANAIIPGVIRLETINSKTVAIWQPLSALVENSEYTIMITRDITNIAGVALYNSWISRFTTTGQMLNDITPPTLTLAVEPPVLPTFVIPGQLIKIDAFASDQGSSVSRVELRSKDLTAGDTAYQFIDRKVVFNGDKPPFIFTVDSAKLTPGHTYQFFATAYDYMMNSQSATIDLTVATSASAPTITLPVPPVQGVLQGISLTLTPESVTGGVTGVAYYLDNAPTPFKTVTLPPYQATLTTLTLSLGSHSIRAVAQDALEQTGEALYTFDVIANPNKPTIAITGSTNGATYVSGSTFVVSASATDQVGIASVSYYLDSIATPLATAAIPVAINTALLTTGSHQITVQAINNLGITANEQLNFTIAPLPNGPPPAPPVLTSVSLPVNSQVTLSGTTAPGARVDISNISQSINLTVYASQSGAFSCSIAAASGDQLSAIAYDFTQSQQPSSSATVMVPAPPVLNHIGVTPQSLAFTAINAWQDLAVTGYYQDTSTATLTASATYSSANPAIASVNSFGRVAALSNGSTTITITVDSMQIQVPVQVSIITLTSISITPSPLSFTIQGASAQLEVTAHYSDNSTRTLSSGISFTSGNSSVATVSIGGLVSAVANGSTLITAYYPGASPVTVPVTVDTGLDTPPQVAILSPASGTSVQHSDIMGISVRATDSNGGVNQVTVSLYGPGNQLIISDTRQITPASLDTTIAFSFTLPGTLTIGSNLSLVASARDTGNNQVQSAAVTLTVTDTTAPTVTIAAPAAQTPYNYGDTVTLTVNAVDAVGITTIGYETSGAFVSTGSSTITPVTPSANTTFSIQVPYGTASSQLRITAYALDSSGNRGTSVPQDVIITNADITPPATRVTAVANPSSSSITAVTYQVTDGLSDLDHVELYFRRNGIGTFNRYIDPDNGNSTGSYLPQSGVSGTISFDSTKTGGDGTYEFYSVGIDKAGNRETAPGTPTVVPDQTTTFTAGTIWTTIATPTAIGEGDTSYDNRNLRISGTTLTLNGSHSYRNIELLNGAVLTHAAATTTTETRLNVTAWSIAIDATSSINVTGKGYLGGRGWHEMGRTIGNVYGSSDGAGGSYGGLGGGYQGRSANPVYGYLTNPDNLGSGGGNWSGSIGGDGGGLIKLSALHIAVDGVISSNGSESAGSAAGDGSGGGVNITTSTISGAGTISANGGGNGNGTGGGGGRIAINSIDNSTLHQENVKALGGIGQYGTGANGTVVFVQPNRSELVLTGQGPSSPWTDLTLPPGYVFDSVTFRDNARVIAHDTFTVTGKVLVTDNSILTHATGNEAGLVINAKSVQVDFGSTIDTTGRGYAGGTGWHEQGKTLGNAYGASDGAGGSYGGIGSGYQNRATGPIYGTPQNPVYLGSGGGNWSGQAGGNGGGRITINATDAIIVNGSIRADGGESGGSAAGDGSGGSILLTTSKLAGTGLISANGGGNGNGVGGGGGRIALYLDYVDATENLAGLYNITAFGQTGQYDSRRTTPGTLFIKYRNQSYGNLYIDAGITDGNGIPNASSSDSIIFTPIGFGTTSAITTDTLTTDGLVGIYPASLVGTRFNPDVTQTDTFVIQSNTANTITVVTPNEHGTNFSDIAGVGKQYAGSCTFDNLFFRRGGNLMLGDLLEIKDTLDLAEYGVLTHFDATAGFVSRLNLTVKNLDIAPTSRIDVTGRGYLGGRSWHEQGRTLGNIYGASDGAGGSYGGLAQGYLGRASNGIYGSLTDPLDLGSGGGNWSGQIGGDGGGLIIIHADNIRNDGSIISNGSESGGSAAGDGSGGSINIVTATLTGTGTIQANGGGNNDGSGGGGGRIAIRYTDTLTLPETNISAIGGTGQYGSPGGNGTVYLNRLNQTYGDLIIDGYGFSTPADTTRIPSGYTFDNLTIRNDAHVVADNAVQVTGTMLLTGNSILTHSVGNLSGLSITANDLRIDPGSIIDVSGRGYLGGTGWHELGRTLGGGYGASDGAGGSYGGLGGGYQGRSSNLVYGDPKNPVFLGSGGGNWSGNAGGNGGGRITITTPHALVVNGAICANGANSAGSAAGSGSGGSIIITTPLLSGTGSIEANGGNNGPGGGGGRIAIFCDTVDSQANLNNLRNITAVSGHGNYNDRAATAGTVYLKYTNGEDHLYIDDNVADANGIANGTAAQPTPLVPIGFGLTASVTGDTLATDGLVSLLAGGLTGLRLNPDITQNETFAIQTNAANSITVVSPNENGTHFSDLAGLGKTYAGSYQFDNITFRRGGSLVMGDLLRVNNTMTLAEYGLLTHYPATTSFISRLSLMAHQLTIDTTSRIDVTGRGYLGGRGWYEQGRTLGNVYGASDGAGGSYGGTGGGYQGRSSNAIYGSMTDPDYLGSGGGNWSGSWGGDGGGIIRISADSILLNGIISANGGQGGGSAAGDGSGGTINITTGSISGSGSINANGAGRGSGAGGGRIALRYQTLGFPLANISVTGGIGNYASGTAGTVYLLQQ